MDCVLIVIWNSKSIRKNLMPSVAMLNVRIWQSNCITSPFERNILELPINQQTKIYTQQSNYGFCIIYSKQLRRGAVCPTSHMPSPYTNKMCLWNTIAPDNNLFQKWSRSLGHIVIFTPLFECLVLKLSIF